MAPIATLPGRTPTNISGVKTAELAITNATKWRRPKAVLLHRIGPVRARKNSVEAEIEEKVSRPWLVTNRGASDRNQFSMDQATRTRAASGKNRRKTRPSEGSVLDQANPATMAAPRMPTAPPRVRATRKKFRPSSEDKPRRTVGLEDAGSFVSGPPK